jgi:hypothetical protein
LVQSGITFVKKVDEKTFRFRRYWFYNSGFILWLIWRRAIPVPITAAQYRQQQNCAG